MSNPDPKNTLELTVRQWKSIARIAQSGAIERPAAWLAFRPGDVVATDGHRLVSIPLPADPGRDFALLPDDVAPWVRGLPKRVESDDDEEEDGRPAMVEHRLTLTMEATTAAAVATVRSSYCGGEIRVTTRPPSWRVRDDAISEVVRIADDPAPTHLLQTWFLRDLQRLVRAFGLPGQPGAAIRRSAHDNNAVIFTFPTVHGDARYVVMRLRPADEVTP